MDNIESIGKFLRSPKYFDMASDVIRCAKRRLCDDLYDGELAHCQKALEAAGLSLDDMGLSLMRIRIDFGDLVRLW